MGKGRKSNRTRQMTVAARPKTDIAHQHKAASKRAKSPQNTTEPQCQNLPDQQIPQFLLNLLMLGQFSMVRPLGGGFAGQGKLGCGKVVTDSCCDTEETEGVTPKGNDDGFNIQCKSCNVVFAVFLGEEEKEIFKRHDKLSPSCSRKNAKQNLETSELEKEHTCTDSNNRHDSGFEEGEDAKKEEEPVVVPKRKTVSISLLEQDVVCDYDSGTEEITDVEAVVTSGEMGMTGKLASARKGKVVTDATDTSKHSPTTLGKDVKEGGAAAGQEPVASPTPSVPIPRVARPWNPKNAKYPQFIEKAERMHSLYSWDKRGYCLGDIADAGLVQLEGTTCELVCFFCAVTVPCLQKHDDAWIEHAIRSPDCDYIRHKKGQDYLNVIIDIYLDGDMEAVNKAANAVAALNIPNGTFRNNSETLTSGATGISLGATGSTYGTTGSDYSTTTSGPVTMNKVSTDLPPNYRGGLRGGAPDSVNSPQTYRPSGQNISSDSLFSAQKSPNNPQTVKITSSNTSSFAVPKPIDSKPKVVRPPRIPKRQVQAREVRARLDTDGAQRIISMGYEAQLVGAVIAEQLIYNGDDFKSFTAMMMAVIDAKEMGDAFPANHYDLGLNSNTSKSAPPMSKGEPAQRPPSPAKSSPAPEPAPERVPSPKALVDELRSLEIENEKLKETQTCTVCMDLERDVLFVPCGHLVVCQNCSPRLKCCPLCRRGIKGIVKVFLS